MRTINFPGATATISESGDVSPIETVEISEEQIVIDAKGNCKKANGKATERCKAIASGAPVVTHAVTVTIGGVRGKIPFTPDR